MQEIHEEHSIVLNKLKDFLYNKRKTELKEDKIDGNVRKAIASF